MADSDIVSLHLVIPFISMVTAFFAAKFVSVNGALKHLSQMVRYFLSRLDRFDFWNN
jgi:hypothetical protein